MQKATAWWPSLAGNSASIERGYELDLRGILALKFVEKWGMVQGATGQEDSAGRATIALMPVEDVIDRAVNIADGLVAKLEGLGWIRQPEGTLEQLAAYAGELESIRSEHAYQARRRPSSALAAAGALEGE
jgi:hypothetical protein